MLRAFQRAFSCREEDLAGMHLAGRSTDSGDANPVRQQLRGHPPAHGSMWFSTPDRRRSNHKVLVAQKMPIMVNDNNIVLAYIDDVVVYSRTLKEHFQRLRIALKD